jgi:hypothetical protein
MGVGISTSGGNPNMDKFLAKVLAQKGPPDSLRIFAQRGVDALRSATPMDSGLTADSWEFEIEQDANGYTIWWSNTNSVNGFNVAIGLQYGHATGTGGWVEGYDYINPALRPIFDELADAQWKEVTSA